MEKSKDIIKNSSNIIEIKNLRKSYFRKKVIENLSLNIEKGKIVGILGPNGSGKTTLIKILTAFLQKSDGTVLIDGNEPGIYTKTIVSYLPDRNFIYEWMTIDEAIGFYKEFFKDFNETKAYELIEFMDLDKTMKVNSLSKGMKEKMNLSMTLAREAKLYILDEPIAGVDPVARDKILDAIINNYSKNSTMLITTHLVKDIENIFDEIIFLRDGDIVLKDTSENLRKERGMSIDDVYKDIFRD